VQKVSGPKREHVRGEWRKLCNEELYYLFSSSNIIWVTKSRRIDRWGMYCKGESRGSYRFSVRRPEGKRPFGRPRARCADSIKMDLQEIEWEAQSGLIWLSI